MFYVYEWYVVKTNEVIYVGKGCGNRYKVRKHNTKFDALISAVECNSRIVKTFDNEADAFEYEKLRIEELHSLGQCICNILDGGFGGSISWWTDEMRERYSANNVMKTSIQRNRMKTNNPMSNASVSAKVGATKRKPLMVDTEQFDCLSDAIKVYGSKVGYWVKVGHTADFKPCYYLANGKKHIVAKHRNLGGAKRVVYNGKVYECQKDICRKFGFSASTLSKYIHRGYTDDGIECRFESAQPVLQYMPYTGARPVLIDDILYPSIKNASEQTNLYAQGIQYALKHSGLYKGHKCEYANQQPILVKSETSSKEGSTTNE